MFEYIRRWWLVNRIAKVCLLADSINRKTATIENDFIVQEKYSLPFEGFLEDRARKYWFGIWKFLSQKRRDIRIQKDRNILYEADRLGLTKIGYDGAMDQAINASTQGHSFAKPTNGLTGFVREYKEAWITLIAALFFLSSWSIRFITKFVCPHVLWFSGC